MKKFGAGFGFGAISGLLFFVAPAFAGGSYGKCLPFFDNSKETVVSNVVRGGALQKGQVDITPEPLSINAFGEDTLDACGGFGSKVKPEAVRRLVDKLSADVIKALLREFPDYSDSTMRALISKIWSSTNGFEHIFCGQPGRDKVGGLHYANRYLQLQQEGKLCRLTNNIVNEEILPQSVYTIGVEMPNGVVDRKKGFSIRQAAEDIFYEGTRTYLRNCQQPSKDRRVCVSRFHRDGSFGNLFVCVPNRGIITFYPLAGTPRGTAECE